MSAAFCFHYLENIAEDERFGSEQARQSQAESERTAAPFIAGLFFGLLIYIALLTLTFAGLNKKPKVFGILLLVVGVIATIITLGYELVALAFFIPAAIIAFRYKPRTTTTTADAK